jgi:hypothetical protein
VTAAVHSTEPLQDAVPGAGPMAWLPTTTTPMGEAAERYARVGWPVLQLAERGKVPAGGHGLLDATCDVARVRELWRRRPHANVGVRIPVGYVVIDVDGPAGVEALRNVAAGAPIGDTLIAQTSRGHHLWFTVPIAVELRQTAGLLGPGVDTRTHRGYVVAPASVHESGASYRWVRRRPPAPLPPCLLAALAVQPVPARTYAPAPRVNVSDRYAAAVLRRECEEVAATGEGGRNHRLFRAWARCTRDGLPLPVDLVRRELTRAGLRAGLSLHEIDRTLREGPR